MMSSCPLRYPLQMADRLPMSEAYPTPRQRPKPFSLATPSGALSHGYSPFWRGSWWFRSWQVQWNLIRNLPKKIIPLRVRKPAPNGTYLYKASQACSRKRWRTTRESLAMERYDPCCAGSAGLR